MTTQAGIRPIRLEEEMRSSYLDYAMSVIVSRALPDVRDGLKPVQRRVLYAMYELGFRPTGPHRKSARIVGEVLGKYHPHGDAPVYDAMVRMAQDFSLRYPLVDGQGNFGSVDNDPPAAMRYTEARLASIALEILTDIERDTVDFTPNFDGSLQEPTVLPSRLPDLLVNGAMGIAVGMATSIPPHNLREVCNAIDYLIGSPDTTVEELLRFIQGPDFPTGAMVLAGGVDGTALLSAYETGHGRAVMKAVSTVEEPRDGRRRIAITQLPYEVNKATLVRQIATLARERKLEGVTEVRDESDRSGIRVVVELRRDAQPDRILNYLYRHTPLQTAFAMNMVALVDGQPRTLNLKQLLQQFINFRSRVVTRRAEHDLKKARARAHILEGLRIALTYLDQVIALIRAAPDVDAARQGLMERFGLSQEQAQAILDTQLRRLARLERQRIEEEYQELAALMAELEALLQDPQKVLEVVRQETHHLAEEHGDPRRTQIIREEARSFSEEELIPNQDVVVTISQRGYVKRLPADTYRIQHRGGKGITGMITREADALQHLLVCDTHDQVLFFTNRGRVFALKCYRLPQEASRTSRGTPLVNLLPLATGERVQTVLAAPRLDGEGYLVLVTARGDIKRTPLQALKHIRGNGLLIMNLRSGDEMVAAALAQEGQDVLLVSRQGKAARFPLAELRVRSRTAGGVRGMRVASLEVDQVVAMTVVRPDAYLLAVSEGGFGKLTPERSFPRHHRPSQGVLAFRVNPKTQPVAAAQAVDRAQEVALVSMRGLVFRTRLSEVPVQGRITQGVWVMRLTPEDRMVAVACFDGTEQRERTGPPARETPAPRKGGRGLKEKPAGGKPKKEQGLSEGDA